MGIRRKAFLVLLLTTLVVWLGGMPAIAVHDTGTFELDGNPQEQGAVGDDWESIFDGGGSNIAESFRMDWTDPTDTTYLHEGGSKDDHDFPDWERTTTDEAPDKDEIMNAFAAAYVVDGDFVLYFGAERFDDEGTAQMGFWFTQDDISISGEDVLGNHVEGDVLVQSNFVNGGTVPEIQVYEWVGSGGSHGALDRIADIQVADCSELDPGDPGYVPDKACAAVNTGEDVVPVWDFDNKDGSEYNSGEFFEGGINLTGLGIDTNCFSTFIAETRTAHPFDARLKDISIGDFDTCATKSGTKVEDLNADGDRDEGEPGLEGWTIHLFGEGIHEHDETDENGHYEFSGLEPGSYTVCETQKEGWTQSMPSSGADCEEHDHLGVAGARGYAIDLDFGEVDSGNDFGNFRNAHKTGKKFEDLDADGVKDEGEAGLEGWRIHLYGQDGQGNDVHEHDWTNEYGTYWFTVPPGDYKVCEEQQTGWSQSFPSNGADCTGHTHDGTITPAPEGYSISLDSNETDTGNHFGNFRSATKSGTKFNDLNGDGDRDQGEPGIAGWEIHLFGEDGQGNAVHEHADTDFNGDYSFTVSPGTYTVCESLESGWTQSLPTSGAGCDGHGGGIGYDISLDSNERDEGNDFGNFQLGRKSGTKFEDLNADGDRDEGEPGLEGWIIHIFDSGTGGEEFDQHAVTDIDGAYSFDVPPGSYTVCEEQQAGWTQSHPSDGADCADHGGGWGYHITLASGGTDEGNDFGNFRSGHKLGTKFEDLNADGDRDEGELGLADWEIHLFGASGGGDAVHEHATTDSDGEYSFDVPPGNYTVCEAIPDGWTQSYPAQGPDCFQHGGGLGYGVTLTSGQEEAGNDFGNFRNAVKSGAKFHDLDADGERDDDEPLLQGWEIHLVGSDGSGAAVHEHDFTGADGIYEFDVPPGTYTVCETLPAESALEPAVSVSMTADPISGNPGDEVTYSYVVKNTSGVTLTNVVVTDSDFGELGVIASLAPGASQTFTRDETLGNDDIDRSVSVTADGGWQQSYPAEGTDCSAHGGGVGYSITLSSGDTETGNDFGNFVREVSSSDAVSLSVVLARRLVRTGVDALGLMVPGFALLAVGIALVAITRRREERTFG